MVESISLVTLNHVDKQYADHNVLKDINLSIQTGEFVAFVGESGGGKSTLLRLVAGLEPATNGTIKVAGHKLKGLNDVARVMFQDDRLLPWMTILENLSFKDRDKKGQDRARELLTLVQLEEYGAFYPGQLSGGQKQRVALARALMASPKLLLLDEPLGALDALTRLRMQTLISDVVEHEQLTTVLITHDVHEAAKMADRIIVIKNGVAGLAVPGNRLNDDEVAIARTAELVQNYILTE